jgi:hypothetical protein
MKKSELKQLIKEVISTINSDNLLKETKSISKLIGSTNGEINKSTSSISKQELANQSNFIVNDMKKFVKNRWNVVV